MTQQKIFTANATSSGGVTPFEFESHSLRVITRDGEPWFVAADVCESLGVQNTSDALKRLDDDEKGVGSIYTPSGEQEMLVINESGLYSLVLGSRKPEAKRFKKWVTSEVLPAIRKSGSYVAPGAATDAPDTAPTINVNMLADAVDRGLMSKRTASGMLKAWLLDQHPGMAAVLAAQKARRAPETKQVPAAAQLQIEVKPRPGPSPPIKLVPRRGCDAPDGMDLVLHEVASHCGVSLESLERSMRTHGLMDSTGVTAKGKEFVACTRRGSRHWKVGALMRHLSA